jgi:hypothetical protein
VRHVAFALMMLASPAVEVQDDRFAGEAPYAIAAEANSEPHQLKSQLSHALNWMNEISVYPPVRVRPTTNVLIVTTGPAVFGMCCDEQRLRDVEWGCAAFLNEPALMGAASAGYRAPLLL